MRIAFYAPLKSPGHPVPSGDRLMARLLIDALGRGGHRVTVVSDLRAYLGDPEDGPGWTRLQDEARLESVRITELWATQGAPDLWFCYHPYYKAPDLLGPALSRRHGIPYVSCEASYSARRDFGIWTAMQAQSLAAVTCAALNICLTDRDRRGLLARMPDARVARLKPFIATDAFGADPAPRPGRLVCVAMMRAGDKLDSYARLAATLALLPGDLDWHLSVAGDGPMRPAVQALFATIPPARISWLGQVDLPVVAGLMATGSVYVWPGCGEAYGLTYLEAQAAGLPVVAQRTAGVPEVVADGKTGFLTPEGDDAAAAAAIARLLADDPLRHRMGQAARRHVAAHHSIAGAALRLDAMLRAVVRAR